MTVDDKGTVTTNGVSYVVPWGAKGPPARGSYTMSVHAAPVFDALPTSSDVHDRLSITYVVLVLHCSVCDDVKTVLDGGSNTLFEVDDRFLKILEYRVKLAGMNSSSRNSSVFMQYAVDESHKRRQAFLEVEALLDHLFSHVRRFVTSNPLPLHPICCGCLSMWSIDSVAPNGKVLWCEFNAVTLPVST